MFSYFSGVCYVHFWLSRVSLLSVLYLRTHPARVRILYIEGQHKHYQRINLDWILASIHGDVSIPWPVSTHPGPLRSRTKSAETPSSIDQSLKSHQIAQPADSVFSWYSPQVLSDCIPYLSEPAVVEYLGCYTVCGSVWVLASTRSFPCLISLSLLYLNA